MNRWGSITVLVPVLLLGGRAGAAASEQNIVLVQAQGRGESPRGEGPRGGVPRVDPRPEPRLPQPPGPWRPLERRSSYQEPAFSRGYADGYMRGIDDRRDRDRYDPVGDKSYRRGDQGYYRDYGSRDAYKNNYRAGFRQGYDEGYRDGARRGR